MGKTSKKEERRNALKRLHDAPTNQQREDLKRALVQYCSEEGVEVRKRGRIDIKIKDLLPNMRKNNPFWDYIRADDLNTNKYRCCKLLND